MNATLPEALVAAELERDPHRAAAEWLARWRDDVAAFVPPAAVDDATVRGRRALPPGPSQSYVYFLDPSGGSSDSMVLAALRRSRPPISTSLPHIVPSSVTLIVILKRWLST